MSVFLSTNNTKPYQIIQNLTVSDTAQINLTSGTNILEVIKNIYIIFTDRQYSNIEVRVENENSSGISLYISNVDGMGNPLHWGKMMNLNNIDASSSDVKFLIKYKWSIINNIYILKRLNVSGNINIYEV